MAAIRFGTARLLLSIPLSNSRKPISTHAPSFHRPGAPSRKIRLEEPSATPSRRIRIGESLRKARWMSKQ